MNECSRGANHAVPEKADALALHGMPVDRQDYVAQRHAAVNVSRACRGGSECESDQHMIVRKWGEGAA